MDEEGTIAAIRENVNFRSANAWTLVFAIFVASIGLNTNSAAVIIGAMLISPLMGPIVGAGLALGINDFDLLRRSFQNLLIAVCLSIFASTCYFLISPLSEVQSELLARTQPTFYDVLIALFGGAAGIVAVSRREKGNAIPGVAIATALMPPLCTAGFGLARLEIKFFAGALYLFVINSVFICLSTYAFVRYMKFRAVSVTDAVVQKRLNQWILTTVAVVVLPSLVLAWHLQRETLFRSRANAFINKEMRYDRSFVVNREILFGWGEPKITVSLIGESLDQASLDLLKEKMRLYSLEPQALEVRQASLEESLEKRMNERMKTESNQLREYQLKLSQRDMELSNYAIAEELTGKISKELVPLFNSVNQVVVWARRGSGVEFETRVLVHWKSSPTKSDREKVSKFLEQRVPINSDFIAHVRNI